jgi:hypothetical protein
VVEKIKDLLKKTSEAVEKGHLLYSNHANERMQQRKILKPDVERILISGYHEVRKDKFNFEMKSWDYAVRGKTIDGRRLRIIIAFVKPSILVITAIDLDQ